jgi:methyl-accepting chemotaxis protein
MKSIIARINATLILVSAATVTLLQVFHGLFIVRNPGEVLSGLGSMYVVSAVLITVACLIVFLKLRPIHAITAKIDSGESLSDGEKRDAFQQFAVVPKLIITVNVVGFILGPVARTLITAIVSKKGFDAADFLVVLTLCIALALMTSLQEIFLYDSFIRKTKESLAVYKFEGESRDMSFGTKIVLVGMASLFLTLIMSGAAGYGFYREIFRRIAEGAAPEKANLAEFLFQVMLAGVCGLIYAFLLISTIVSDLKRNIMNQVDWLKGIADGQGDLKSRIAIVQFDETGKLSHHLNGFVATLEDLLRKVRDLSLSVSRSALSLADSSKNASGSVSGMEESVAKVHSAVGRQSDTLSEAESELAKMAGSIDIVAEQVSTQAGFVEQSSASVSEMAANIASVTKLTEKAEELSVNLRGVSAEGDSAIRDTSIAMREIAEASKSVSDIVKVIQKISSQTNLLAMNAAIEAAHAGEAGRGFAVVANEVRTLAGSSATSAREIVELIKNMTGKIEAGVARSEKAGASFKKIADGIDDTSELVKTISASMEEQKIGTEEILKSVNSLVDATEKIKSLTIDQRANSGMMMEAMRKIVEASQLIEEAVQEETGGTQTLSRVVSLVSQEAEKNKESVTGLEAMVKRFNLD